MSISTDSSHLPPSMRTPSLDALIASKDGKGSQHAAAAVNELLKQTWQDMGVPRFRGSIEGAGDSEAEVEAALSAASKEQADEEAELTSEAEALDAANEQEA